MKAIPCPQCRQRPVAERLSNGMLFKCPDGHYAEFHYVSEIAHQSAQKRRSPNERLPDLR